MKLRMMLVAGATGLLLTTGYAVAENAQQTRMKTCNADATAKSLSGTDREAFMKTCLSAGSHDSGGKHLTAQQEKMKTCNADANAKKLKGADRKTFMKSCLSGS